MKQNNVFIFFSFFFLFIGLTSCEMVGGVFKAGIWVGLIGLFLVIGLIIFIMGKFRN